MGDFPLPYGIAILQGNDFAVTIANALHTFAQIPTEPYFTQVGIILYSPSDATAELDATASDGTLYVPLEIPGSAGLVWVYPNSGAAPYTITQGLGTPVSVAAGL
jgi:hypothetical protein